MPVILSKKMKARLRNTLISPKRIQKPVIIETYSEEFDKNQFKGKGGKYFHLGKKVEDVIGQIIEKNKRRKERKHFIDFVDWQIRI